MCTMYRLFKKQLNFKDYLVSCNYRERISLTNYPCANSKIPVYNQAYMYETELCTSCDLNLNGDEYHYIMICPYFRQSSEHNLKHYFYTRPNMLKFSQYFSLKTKIVQVGKIDYCYYDTIQRITLFHYSVYVIQCHIHYTALPSIIPAHCCLYVVNVYTICFCIPSILHTE